MTYNRKRDLKDVSKNLFYETTTEIARESGFNSRQAMDNWLRRKGWAIKHVHVLVPIDRGVIPKHENKKKEG